MSRLDEIKKLNERGEILIEATTEDAAAFSWLIERVEELERENERLEDKLTEWRVLSSDEARRAIDDVVG